MPEAATMSRDVPSEASPGVSAPAQPDAANRIESQVPRPGQIGSQVSGALLGLSMPDTANSAAAPGTQPPATATIMATMEAYTEFAVAAPAAGQAADSGTAGGGFDEAAASGERSSAATAGSGEKSGASQGHLAFTPLPIIPKWHIKPGMRPN
jgi:hypothetical protein